jgi:hypothetical protein
MHTEFTKFTTAAKSPHRILRRFRKNLRKVTNLLALSCLYLLSHGTTRFPLDGFSFYLVFEDFSKNCLEGIIFIKI